MTKAGYVAIIGKPNAGKSTLMNSIIGTKLSIVTPKPQTTRKPVLGIYTTDEVQMVFFDTPGVLQPKYELQRTMMNYITEAISDADVVLVLVDVSEYKPGSDFFPKNFLKGLEQSGKPLILALNKIDLLKNVKNVLPIIEDFRKKEIFDEYIPMSALKETSVSELLKVIESKLPESPFFFDSEELSTQSERFFVSEIIREHIFRQFQQEVPYSTEVNILEFKERTKGKWYILADIIVERATQKAIIIGAKGSSIKRIGEKARKDIEEHLQMPVFLELFVKVRDKWRDDKNMLKSFGY